MRKTKLKRWRRKFKSSLLYKSTAPLVSTVSNLPYFLFWVLTTLKKSDKVLYIGSRITTELRNGNMNIFDILLNRHAVTIRRMDGSKVKVYLKGPSVPKVKVKKLERRIIYV